MNDIEVRLVGKVTWVNRGWEVQCEPHVRTRMRRLFGQVSQRAGDVVRLSDNPENSRDLLWFLERYPMEFPEPEHERHLRQQAKAHEDQESMVANLLNHRLPLEDFELALPPREYQVEAVMMLQLMKGLLLTDDLGLGKTVSAIAATARVKNLPTMIVTYDHLVSQWVSEFAKFAPHLNVHALKSGKPYSLLSKPKRGQPKEGFVPTAPDVIVSNYHKIRGWAEELKGWVRYLVFDEVQELRHSDSAKYAAAAHLAEGAELKMGLSATPIYNYGNEFFNVLDVIRPGSLGTKSEFLREWCTEHGSIKDPVAFGAHLRREGLMLRRTRAEVGREVPPCTPIPYTIDADPAVFHRIKGSAIELAKTILAQNPVVQGSQFVASREFNSLMRQATGIAKAPFVAEFVRMLLASEKCVVLFGWHREVYGIWMEALKEFNPMLYTGTESPRQKDMAKMAFLEGRCRVLIVSLRSGAGLDGLQAVCRVGVFGELDWSHGVLEQCVGRYRRDGQEEESMAYYLLSSEGCDPIMSDVLGLKKMQLQGVQDPNAELVQALEMDVGGVRRMAEGFLLQQGLALAAPEDSKEVA